MSKLVRVGIGVLAGVAAGIAVYSIFASRRKKERLLMPELKKSNVVKLPSSRPPYAEEAEAGSE